MDNFHKHLQELTPFYLKKVVEDMIYYLMTYAHHPSRNTSKQLMLARFKKIPQQRNYCQFFSRIHLLRTVAIC